MHERRPINEFSRLDTLPPAFRKALQARVEKELFRAIRPWERFLLVAVTVLCLGGGAVCALYAFAANALTGMQRFYLFITVPIAAAGAFWCISTLRRGMFHTMRDVVRIPVVVWSFLVVVLVVQILTGQLERAIMKTIAAIVVIGFPITWDRIRASELLIQETVLRTAVYTSDLSKGPPEDTDRRFGAESANDLR